MEIRRLTVIKDVVFSEGGLPAQGVTRVAACAVIANPYAGTPHDDVEQLIAFGAVLGEKLVREALPLLSDAATSHGKAAIVGSAGDIEHAAALLHPQMGMPIRAAIGGGAATIPSNAKIGAIGESVDVPLGHKDDVWSFDHFDTLSVMVPNAPRPDEIVVIVALADGGRPRPRVKKTQ